MTRHRQSARAKAFARARHIWNAQVTEEPRLSASERLVGIHIAQKHLNKDQLEAWPGQASVANAIGVSEKTVQRGARKLAQFGYWTILRGKRKSNTYVFDLLRRIMDELCDEQADHGRQRPQDETSVSDRTGHSCPTNLNREHNNEPKAADAGSEVSLKKFATDSPNAKDWNEALKARRLGNLEDYDIVDTESDRPLFVMPFRWPDISEVYWPMVEAYLKSRRKRN